jgi:succinyl-diaminopimelate desuccinylase
MDVDYVDGGRVDHSVEHPRVNVIGRLEGRGTRPLVHLNGHFDVVPPGSGWTVDPFGGEIRDGRLYGRGASDMKAGLAAAAFAVEAIRRAGAPLTGSVEVSGTVDEESGGFAGVAHLCEIGRISSEHTDYVIIPEPFGPARICVDHRGVHWFDVTAHGRTAHGSMPHLGRSAIADMAALLELLRTELGPRLGERVSAMPVVPSESRQATLNVNALHGGQAIAGQQSPCVADDCRATFDRRFLIEENLDEVRREILELISTAEAADPGRRYTVTDRLDVLPTQAPEGSPLVAALQRAIERVVGTPAELVASPGTYDQKHVVRIAGVEPCVAYGPGPLTEAHRPDESCALDDIVAAAGVTALTLLELVGGGPPS